jgi:hypothetical protein
MISFVEEVEETLEPLRKRIKFYQEELKEKVEELQEQKERQSFVELVQMTGWFKELQKLSVKELEQLKLKPDICKTIMVCYLGVDSRF